MGASEQSERDSLIEAIELIGSVAEFAALMHCSATAVYAWIHRGLPIDRVIEVEALTAKRVSRERLYAGVDQALLRRARKRKAAAATRARPKRY
jgi:DNA-binding transcriptional regulator YdaS (Cro superfamily)